MDTKRLVSWFKTEKRDLPWRFNPSPYAVWVSEVMLQQTQVSVVIPYFERWMQSFPTVEDLAGAPVEAVIKAWEGLGYYSRARHLHAGACYVVEHFGGRIPEDEALLSQIKGLGPYTVGAIRAFAFQQKAAAVDGNVLRVLARYYCIDDDITKLKTQKAIRLLADELLPDEEPWVTAEALIELGAKVCSRRPLCGECPLRPGCLAYRHGRQGTLPIRKSGSAVTALYREVAVIRNGSRFLLSQVPEGQVMAGLHEFPYFESTKEGMSSSILSARVKDTFGIVVQAEELLEEIRHSFTRYRVRLKPTLLRAKESLSLSPYRWVEWEDVKQLAFSSGHRRIVKQLYTVIR